MVIPSAELIRSSARSITIMLVWCSVSVLCSLYATIPMLPLFGDEFNASLTATAWAGTTFSIGYMIGCIVFGALSDRYGTSTIIIIGMFLLAAITPLVGLSHSLLSMISIRTLQGIIAASYAPAALAFIVETYPERNKITALGYLSTGMLSAGVFGQLLSGSITQSFHWSYVFYFLGIVYFISAICLALLFKQNKSPQLILRIKHRPFSLWHQYGSIMRNTRLYPLFLITVTILFSFVAMYTLLGVRLSSPEFSLSQSDILFVRAFGLFGILMSPLAGKLVKQVGFSRLLQFNLSLSLLSSILIGYSNSITAIVIASICFVAGIALTTPLLVGLTSRLAEPGTSVLAINLYSLILFLGAALGPLVAAYSIEIVGSQFSFVLLSCVLALSLLFTCFLHKTT